MVTEDLRWNEIGPSGAAAIMAMLQRNHSLVDVRLVGNGIPPSIQAQIDDLLEKNRTCKLLQGPAPVGPASENRMYPETETGLVRNSCFYRHSGHKYGCIQVLLCRSIHVFTVTNSIEHSFSDVYTELQSHSKGDE